MYHFEKKEPYGVELLLFDRIENKENTAHCFTARKGGVSEGVCDSLNMSFNREINRENVKENLRRASLAIGVPFESLTMVPQIHSNKVKVIKKEDAGRGVSRPAFEEGFDAMVTNVPGVTLCTIHGDCIPVFLYDSKNGAVGMIHSGWRGTFGRIAAKTAETMKREYNTDLSELEAVIGPGICGECFEVSDDVYTELLKCFGEKIAGNERICKVNPKASGKWLVSLPDIVYLSLIEAGLREENIDRTGICTCCEANKDKFFSHRREKGKTGAMTGMIGIRENCR
ncbi:MAG: peptidoglycan editing factor PgeF [Clostridia bacterium]|nr:peptidoglycan editing factor PgeF [Clostridia bacterium]